MKENAGSGGEAHPGTATAPGLCKARPLLHKHRNGRRCPRVLGGNQMADLGKYIDPAAGPISLAGSNAAAIVPPSVNGAQLMTASSGPSHRREREKLCAGTIPHLFTGALLVSMGSPAQS